MDERLPLSGDGLRGEGGAPGRSGRGSSGQARGLLSAGGSASLLCLVMTVCLWYA